MVLPPPLVAALLTSQLIVYSIYNSKLGITPLRQHDTALCQNRPPGAGASSIIFWWRRCTLQSLSNKYSAVP
jgi:hypothetical protein